MTHYGYGYNTETVVVPVRPKDVAQMNPDERRKAFPHTIPVYHAGTQPTAEEIGRAVQKQREGNPFFRFWGTTLLPGTTKPINHVPVGHEGVPVGYQSDLALETA